MSKSIILSLVSFLCACSAHAALVLHIDTTSEVFWLTGSASGTTTSSPGFNVWAGTGSNSGSTTTGLFPGATPSITFTNGVTTSGARISADSTGGFSFGFSGFPFSTATTINGTGVAGAVDYSSATANQKAFFEAGITQGTISSGSAASGFGSLSVVSGVIPEPSTAASMIGVCALSFAVLRNRKRSR